ncbi:MAG: hypothetical protein J0626_04525, partial [Rhodospirillaceae bacterium]|nr:hypothetical protein [Rhodospirillaceae bacterium]
DYHTVALKSDGTVWNWGQNGSGQVGVARSPWQLAPVRVAGIPAMRRIVAGGYGTLAQTADGRVFEWGAYFSADLSNSSNPVAPAELPSLAGSLAFARSSGHALVLRPDGAPLAWGNDAHGQLGDGKAVIRLWPEQVVPLAGVVSAAAGIMHSVAVKGDGTVWEWGIKDRGFGSDTGFGFPPVPSTSTPTIVAGISGVVAVAEGGYHTYALKSDGSVWSWGNDFSPPTGNLGDPTSQFRPSPIPIAGLSNIKAIHTGRFSGVALSKTGTVWTWGYNYLGQLGDGTTISHPTPAQVPGLFGITDIAAGDYSVLALRNDGTVWAWGSNGNGQLGDGTLTNSPSPLRVSGLD